VTTRRHAARCVVLAALVLIALAPADGTAAAVPPPPPNPSDSQIEAGKAAAAGKADRVGQLANRLAELDAERLDRQAEAELKQELANKAQIDLAAAQDAAAAARYAADQAATEAAAATRAIEDARRRVDQFASGSYQQGSTIGSMSAFLGARGPDELLARAQFLNAIGQSQLDALDGLERARADQANKDSAARKALEEANAKQAAAERAKRDADAAYAAAQRATQELLAQVSAIDTQKAEVERQLAEAQAAVAGLQEQRHRYLDWLAAKQREEAAAAAAARPLVAGGDVGTVIARALSQRGVPYAWGGGDASGPTRGSHDGGIADAFGDYAKVGFDCSGLMIYAFAGAGIRLPHYSGYQYAAGRHVPLAQRRPGDLLFWATGGRIHHVALYLGDDFVVEAPYSGSVVRVAPIRYDGILPMVTRLL
jgi:peptidoglycan DL-endopeptidase RipA